MEAVHCTLYTADNTLYTVPMYTAHSVHSTVQTGTSHQSVFQSDQIARLIQIFLLIQLFVSIVKLVQNGVVHFNAVHYGVV